MEVGDPLVRCDRGAGRGVLGGGGGGDGLFDPALFVGQGGGLVGSLPALSEGFLDLGEDEGSRDDGHPGGPCSGEQGGAFTRPVERPPTVLPAERGSRAATPVFRRPSGGARVRAFARHGG